MRWRGIGALAVAAALLAACGGPDAGGDDGGFLRDTGGGMPPPTPSVDMPPSPVPYTVTTLRGTAPEAERVIVQGVDMPPSRRVLGTSNFCIDVPMPTPGVYELVVRSQSEDGLLSAPTEPIVVEFDPSAPPVAGAETCNGAPPEGCPRETEICGNGEDDNCNSLIDDEDPDCFPCEDDALEPNDDITAPRVEPIRHDGLKLCPTDQDFYGVYAEAGDTLDVRLFFSHAEGDVDVELYGTDGMVAASAVSTTDDEAIEGFAVETTGEYKVRVFSPTDAEVSYSLDLTVTPGT